MSCGTTPVRAKVGAIIEDEDGIHRYGVDAPQAEQAPMDIPDWVTLEHLAVVYDSMSKVSRGLHLSDADEAQANEVLAKRSGQKRAQRLECLQFFRRLKRCQP